jgi:hypothetical protein
VKVCSLTKARRYHGAACHKNIFQSFARKLSGSPQLPYGEGQRQFLVDVGSTTDLQIHSI